MPVQYQGDVYPPEDDFGPYPPLEFQHDYDFLGRGPPGRDRLDPAYGYPDMRRLDAPREQPRSWYGPGERGFHTGFRGPRDVTPGLHDFGAKDGLYNASNGSGRSSDTDREWDLRRGYDLQAADSFYGSGYTPPRREAMIGMMKQSREWRDWHETRNEMTPPPYGRRDNGRGYPHQGHYGAPVAHHSRNPPVGFTRGLPAAHDFRPMAVPPPPGAEQSLWFTDPIFNFVYSEFRDKDGRRSACVASLCAKARNHPDPAVSETIKQYDAKAKKRKKKAGLVEYLTEVHAAHGGGQKLFAIQSYDLLFISLGL